VSTAVVSPKVTVVTPTKNRLKLLCEAIASVRAQTFEAWEHIIVDDGSDDGTVEELERLSRDDSRIRFIRRTGDRGGANFCRNIGIVEAAAEFVVFLDSDDLLMEHCLARRVEVLQRNLDIDFAVFQARIFTKTPGDSNATFDQELCGDDLLRFLLFENPWIITGPIWRKSVLKKLKGFDESLPRRQDIDLHLRAILLGCRYLRFTDADHYVRWQYDPGKVSQRPYSPGDFNAVLDFSAKLESMVAAYPGMSWTRQRALCNQYLILAESCVRAGSLSSGLTAWRRMRARKLGPGFLYLTGALLLVAQAVGPTRRLGERVTHKWKGWMRLRTNPELLPGQKMIPPTANRAQTTWIGSKSPRHS
jgi:glycosyltransferase involved in cell wall biosynthesis